MAVSANRCPAPGTRAGRSARAPTRHRPTARRLVPGSPRRAPARPGARGAAPSGAPVASRRAHAQPRAVDAGRPATRRVQELAHLRGGADRLGIPDLHVAEAVVLPLAGSDDVDDRQVVLMRGASGEAARPCGPHPAISLGDGQPVRNRRAAAQPRRRVEGVDRDVVARRVGIDIGEHDVVQAAGHDVRRLGEAQEREEAAIRGPEPDRGQAPTHRHVRRPARVRLQGHPARSRGCPRCTPSSR